MDKLEIVKENIALKKKIILYEISTKLDFEKIEKLQDELKILKHNVFC